MQGGTAIKFFWDGEDGQLTNVLIEEERKKFESTQLVKGGGRFEDRNRS